MQYDDEVSGCGEWGCWGRQKGAWAGEEGLLLKEGGAKPILFKVEFIWKME